MRIITVLIAFATLFVLACSVAVDIERRQLKWPCLSCITKRQDGGFDIAIGLDHVPRPNSTSTWPLPFKRQENAGWDIAIGLDHVPHPKSTDGAIVERAEPQYDYTKIPVSGVKSILTSLNEFRSRKGIPLLKWDPNLTYFATLTNYENINTGHFCCPAHDLKHSGAQVMSPGK